MLNRTAPHRVCFAARSNRTHESLSRRSLAQVHTLSVLLPEIQAQRTVVPIASLHHLAAQWTVGLPPTRWKERLGGMCPVPKHFLRPGCLASHQTPDELSEDKLGEGALRTIAGVAFRGQVQETALLRVVSRQRAANHEAAYIHVDTDDEAARHPRDEQHASTSLAGRPASRGCIRTSRPERRAAGAARVHLASEGSGFSSSGTSSF